MPMWIDWLAEISAIFVVQRRGTESIALLVAESSHASSVVRPRSHETIPHRHVGRLLTEIAIGHHSLLETEVGQICRLLGVSSWPDVLVTAVNQERSGLHHHTVPQCGIHRQSGIHSHWECHVRGLGWEWHRVHALL